MISSMNWPICTLWYSTSACRFASFSLMVPCSSNKEVASAMSRSLALASTTSILAHTPDIASVLYAFILSKKHSSLSVRLVDDLDVPSRGRNTNFGPSSGDSSVLPIESDWCWPFLMAVGCALPEARSAVFTPSVLGPIQLHVKEEVAILGIELFSSTGTRARP